MLDRVEDVNVPTVAAPVTRWTRSSRNAMGKVQKKLLADGQFLLPPGRS